MRLIYCCVLVYGLAVCTLSADGAIAAPARNQQENPQPSEPPAAPVNFCCPDIDCAHPVQTSSCSQARLFEEQLERDLRAWDIRFGPSTPVPPIALISHTTAERFVIWSSPRSKVPFVGVVSFTGRTLVHSVPFGSEAFECEGEVQAIFGARAVASEVTLADTVSFQVRPAAGMCSPGSSAIVALTYFSDARVYVVGVSEHAYIPLTVGIGEAIDPENSGVKVLAAIQSFVNRGRK
jgi:hypothetical protein